ncbi:MAG: ABC transporter permease [Spirochaetaceae bacterium]|jgi:peptide/nickel transport system permease protein|nr:ABC transporter permease [Spirochaetaceae bacterium]
MTGKTVIKKLAGAAVTLFLATLLLFIIVRLAPGDPVELVLWEHPGEYAIQNSEAYRERIAEIRAQYGLDRSIAVQYAQWLKRLVRFDLGNSIHTGRPIATEIAERLPATVLLSITAIIIQLVFGTLLGIQSALKSGKTLDNVIRFFCVLFASIPAFVIGLALLYAFGVSLHVFEIGSDASIQRLWLPAIVLALSGLPQLIRMVRANLLSELGQTYVSAALCRGLSKGRVVKHALRNALLPTVTVIALSFTAMISGAVVVETIFSWPGIGSYALNSIVFHDYPVIQGYALIMVSAVITVNLAVDLLYTVIDPRVARGRNK